MFQFVSKACNVSLEPFCELCVCSQPQPQHAFNALSSSVTHRGSLKTFTLSDGRRINMVRPSWLEDVIQQNTELNETNQDAVMDGSVLDGIVMSPVDSVHNKRFVVLKTFRENAMDRFPSILKLT